MHNSQCTIHNARFTMHDARCIIHNAQFTMHNSRCTIHNAQFTMHNAQFCREAMGAIDAPIRSANLAIIAMICAGMGKESGAPGGRAAVCIKGTYWISRDISCRRHSSCCLILQQHCSRGLSGRGLYRRPAGHCRNASRREGREW